MSSEKIISFYHKTNSKINYNNSCILLSKYISRNIIIEYSDIK